MYVVFSTNNTTKEYSELKEFFQDKGIGSVYARNITHLLELNNISMVYSETDVFLVVDGQVDKIYEIRFTGIYQKGKEFKKLLDRYKRFKNIKQIVNA